MKREPRTAAERDDRRDDVSDDAEHPAAFVVAVALRHLAGDSHRRRRTAAHRRARARRRDPRWRRSVLLRRVRFSAEPGAAEIADQLAGLSLAAAHRTLDLLALARFASCAFRKRRACLHERAAVSVAKCFRVGVGFVAARAPFHDGQESSGASFSGASLDDIEAKCDTLITASRLPRRQTFPSPPDARASSEPVRQLFATRPSRRTSRCRPASTARAACSP